MNHMVRILLILFIIQLSYAQKSISIKIGDRILTKPGMQTINDVIAYYDSLGREYPDSIEIKIDLAEIYKMDKQYRAAIGVIKSILQRYPEKLPKLSVTYARCYEELGIIDSAIYILKKAKNERPDYLGIPLTLAEIYIRQKEYLSAFHEFEQIDTSKVRDNYIFWNDYASVCAELDTNLNEAIEYAMHAVSLDSSWYVIETLGDVLLKAKKYEAALFVYERVALDAGWERVREKIEYITSKITEREN